MHNRCTISWRITSIILPIRDGSIEVKISELRDIKEKNSLIWEVNLNIFIKFEGSNMNFFLKY